MYFGTKSYLKSNRYHTAKHTLNKLYLFEENFRLMLWLRVFKSIFLFKNVLK
jgi:hypothetical protein